MYMKLITSTPKVKVGFLVAAMAILSLSANTAAASSLPRFDKAGMHKPVQNKSTVHRMSELAVYLSSRLNNNFTNSTFIIDDHKHCVYDLVNKKTYCGEFSSVRRSIVDRTSIVFNQFFVSGETYYTPTQTTSNGVNQAWSTSLAGFDICLRLLLAIAIIIGGSSSSKRWRQRPLRFLSRRVG